MFIFIPTFTLTYRCTKIFRMFSHFKTQTQKRLHSNYQNIGVEKYKCYLYDYSTAFCKKHNFEKIHQLYVVCFILSWVSVTILMTHNVQHIQISTKNDRKNYSHSSTQAQRKMNQKTSNLVFFKIESLEEKPIRMKT